MKVLLPIALLVALLAIWRSKPASDPLASSGEAGGGDAARAEEEASDSAAPVAEVDVNNDTSNEANTLTIGNGTTAEIGGDLILGGSGGLATGGDAPGGGDAGEVTNSVNTTLNTITVGNDSVFHVGSGRRPARSSDYEEFWTASVNHQLQPDGANSERALQPDVLHPADLERAANDPYGLPKTTVRGQPQSLYDQVAGLWNHHFGNVIAFPGQPIN